MKNFVRKYKNYCMTGLFVVCLACLCYLVYPTMKSDATTDKTAADKQAASIQQLSTSNTAKKEEATTAAADNLPEEASTVAKQETKEEKEEEPKKLYIAANDLNLRSKPSTTSKSLKKLDPGEAVTWIANEASWYKVKAGSKTGYIKKVFAIDTWTAFSETNALNVREKASTKSKVLTQIDKGDSMIVLKKSGKWYQIKHGKTTGYVRGDYITFQFFGFVDGSKVNMREKNNLDSKIIIELRDGAEVTILDKVGSWYKVRYNLKVGYIHEAYISFNKIINVSTASKGSGKGSSSGKGSGSSSSSLGNAIVSYARQFVGNPYVYGGTSLTRGADCSGFTQSVYRHFGIYLPRSSAAQRTAGRRVASLSQARPGDLICYYGHVAIYMGGNRIVHASNAKTGIKISNNARYRSIASIRRVF